MIRSGLMGLTIAMTVTAVSSGIAGDEGGKVAWNKDPQKAMKLAKKRGAGMMLYFTSEG